MRKKVSKKMVVYRKKRSSVGKRAKRTSVQKRRSYKRTSVKKQSSRRSTTKRRSAAKRRSTSKRSKTSLEKFRKTRRSNIKKASITREKLRRSLKKLKTMKGGQGVQENVPKRISKRPPKILIPKVKVISNRLQAIEVIRGSRRKVRENLN